MLEIAESHVGRIQHKCAYIANNQFINFDLHPIATAIPFSALKINELCQQLQSVDFCFAHKLCPNMSRDKQSRRMQFRRLCTYNMEKSDFQTPLKMENPPSIGRLTPVMNEAASEHKN